MGTCGSSKVPATHVGLVARGGSRVEQSELQGRDQGHGRDPPRLHEQAGSLTLQPNHRQPTCHHSSTPDLPAPMTTTTESARGYISSHTGRGLGENHLAVRPSLAYGRTLPGRSRGPCSETPYSPRGHVASLVQSKRVCAERPTVQKLSFVGPEDRNREAPLSASQGTSSQRVVMERDGEVWDGSLDVKPN